MPVEFYTFWKDHFIRTKKRLDKSKYYKDILDEEGVQGMMTKIQNEAVHYIINPFDPAIRDRQRLEKIFDFKYKIEIFVPKEKRVWGYYVYPLLQGNTFIGRIELKADRKAKQLNILNFWLEDVVVWDDKQQEKLDVELASFALLVGIERVRWLCLL